ncbi:hypothetical protein IWW43_003602 [Coemansia sp. RSA 1935]|nr:hypothetical protein IW142_004906 [Coemansia sp. RSA 564]KAJ2184742.1 hypothetical protein EV181_004222 [Coemansia sp. RSA 532]KAJ2246238.1 hypothetical protein GGH97_002548 [Coemansia sp. RSA 475]KAJ2407922.1 hypothetical protein J3F80_002462 [Coemansia sp. RSA 2526]KAJ2531711.1 hypothetical protein IWW43_003602 [Coemansia sp. RSA 1935]KAJ2592248.1 hypothetical protein IWW49_001136 [Coemansia sp. RSA 1797]
MYARTVSLFALATFVAASPLQVRKDDALPTDIGVILAEIAYNIGTTQKYGSLIADAAQNIADIEDQSDDSEVAQIVSSLYSELDKQNDAKEAASLAVSIATEIEGGLVPTEATKIASSFVSEFKNSKLNTNMADNLDVLIEFVENRNSVMPSGFMMPSEFDDLEDDESSETGGDVEGSESQSAGNGDEDSENNSADNGDEDSESSGVSRISASMLLLSMGAMLPLF